MEESMYTSGNGSLRSTLQVTKKLMGRKPIPGLHFPGRLISIVNTLFPQVPTIMCPKMSTELGFLEIMSQEVIEAGRKIPTEKAPRPDGIPDLVIKQISIVEPEMLGDLFNACPRDGMFSKVWKTAKLVLLRK
ncbi:Beta-hexosaminidase [Aphis craccivora]|uniref:Beta-hexosaminidase n=1 Tax=Aphis craccivora TaxID=307492 RepID=A0A6G0VMG2_APHCR|nr:Beta-hexosaminidase [Aphis craccivora]